jgi:hypothetical protein
VPHGEIVDGSLFIASGKATEVLETVNGAFDLVTLTIDGSVKGTLVTHVTSFCDGKTDAPTTE